ncbi:hypothetical protein [Methylobacterium sp. V23]|uniref:hypothetical protein n=1 Tax=Methylobacterium sp. V23 TaxID=2044878 RepID=UPI000CDB3CC0|nr:hypothetical protein [Methylobacterium sp. V23]POR42185.1 hypothetical protein CRT23_15030 [Methylobacterium sp. V23]
MRYPGGKGRCYRHILSLMKPHDTYVETHLGGGAVMRHKRPSARSIGIELDPSVVARWRERGSLSFELLNGDALEFLRTFPFTGSELVYSDPPYLPQTRRRARVYRHDHTPEQHVELLEVLLGLPCAVIVSGYRSELYDRMLAGWRSVEFPGDSHVGPRVEVAWLNYPEPAALHDHAYIGADFRERERIRRRRDGLARRIGGLDARERHALFERLAATHGTDMRRALEAVS